MMVVFRAAIGLWALVVLFSPALAEVDADDENEESKDASHGFGTDIDWVQWDDAITTAVAADKPIMLMIHKTWCGACKQLKKSFEESNKRKELVTLSQKFVMSNTEDDEEPEDTMYAPDGGYIPRILFLDKYGELLGVNNKKNFPNNAYYYPQVPDVIRGMKEALKVVKKGEKVSTDKKPNDAETKGTKETKADESEKNKEVEEGSPPAKPEKIEKPAKKPKEDAKTEKEASKKVKKETTESGENKPDKKAEGGCPHAAAAKKAAAAKEKAEKGSKGADEKSKPSQSKKNEEEGKKGDGATKKSKSSEEKKKKTEL